MKPQRFYLPPMSPAARERVHSILALVCDTYQVAREDLLGPRRPWCLVWPRWVAVYLIDKYIPLTTTDISAILGRDDYDVTHAVQGVATECSLSLERKVELDQLERVLAVRGYRPIPRRRTCPRAIPSTGGAISREPFPPKPLTPVAPDHVAITQS